MYIFAYLLDYWIIYQKSIIYFILISFVLVSPISTVMYLNFMTLK